MGISYLADAVTGLTLEGGEPIVAVIVKKVQGGYPPPVNSEVLPAIRPHDVYVPACPPFRAAAGEYGADDIVPDGGQPAFDMFLALRGHADWVGLAKASFGYDAQKPLGVVAVSLATWEAMSGIMESYDRNRETDVDTVLSVMREISAEHGENWRWKPGANLMTLQGHGVELPSGKVLDLPLAYALSSMDFTGKIDPDFADAIVYDKRWENAVTDVDGADNRWLRDMLGAFWDGLAMANGLYAVNRAFFPSPNAGQGRNDLHVAAVSMSAVTEAAGVLAGRVLDGWETSAVELDRLLEIVEETRKAVEDAVVRSKVSAKP